MRIMEITISIVTPDGNIQRVVSCPESMVDIQVGAGEIAVLQDSRDTVHWFDMTDIENPVRMDKSLVPHTINGNLITLPGDALTCEVTGPITDSFDIPAGETELEFTADVPGQYILRLRGVKYLPTEIDLAI